MRHKLPPLVAAAALVAVLAGGCGEKTGASSSAGKITACAEAGTQPRSPLVAVLTEPDGGVTLTVTDDGCGFDMTNMASFVSDGHYGLAGMRERVELTSGRYTITSAPGRGTRVEVWMSAADREVTV